VTNKLASEVNDDLHQWRSQEALLLGVISACDRLSQPLANFPGMSECQQLDFIESIDPLTSLQQIFTFLMVILSFCFGISTLFPVWPREDVVMRFK
jgi:hypothetical protein